MLAVHCLMSSGLAIIVTLRKNEIANSLYLQMPLEICSQDWPSANIVTNEILCVSFWCVGQSICVFICSFKQPDSRDGKSIQGVPFS